MGDMFPLVPFRQHSILKHKKCYGTNAQTADQGLRNQNKTLKINEIYKQVLHF